MAKKLSMVMLAVLATVFLCGNVVATTWNDVWDPATVITLNPGDPYAYSHDLSRDNFNYLTQEVNDYSLTIRLIDDRDPWYRPFELALIDQPGITADRVYFFSCSNSVLGLSLEGLYMLNTTGKLNVTIYSLYGDFIFDSSILNASGRECPPTSVPEGNAMIVLGAGLFGLGGCARRMFKS